GPAEVRVEPELPRGQAVCVEERAGQLADAGGTVGEAKRRLGSHSDTRGDERTHKFTSREGARAGRDAGLSTASRCRWALFEGSRRTPQSARQGVQVARDLGGRCVPEAWEVLAANEYEGRWPSASWRRCGVRAWSDNNRWRRCNRLSEAGYRHRAG